MRTRSAGLLILVLPLLATSCATMVPVAGRVVPGPEGDGRMDDAIVYVESRKPGGGRAFPARATADTITMAEGRFAPVISSTAVGRRIVFKNEDQIFHSPFSRSPAAPFRGRPLRSRQTRVVEVRSSGMVRVFCELHARESADVLVLRDGSWTRADTLGLFSLGELRRGRYTLHAWHPILGDRSVPLTISSPGPVNVNVRY